MLRWGDAEKPRVLPVLYWDRPRLPWKGSLLSPGGSSLLDLTGTDSWPTQPCRWLHWFSEMNLVRTLTLWQLCGVGVGTGKVAMTSYGMGTLGISW